MNQAEKPADLTATSVEALADVVFGWIRRDDWPDEGSRETAHDLVLELFDSGLLRPVDEVKAEAIREVADRWQRGAWADVLSIPDRGIMTKPQAVLEWLRAQAPKAPEDEVG